MYDLAFLKKEKFQSSWEVLQWVADYEAPKGPKIALGLALILRAHYLIKQRFQEYTKQNMKSE